MKKCDIDSNFVCRTHKGIVALDINFPNLGNYCDDYVEAMHEELHKQLDDRHFWQCGCNGLVHKDIENEWVLPKCKFCEVDNE